MKTNKAFESIRPYKNKEVNEKINIMLQEPDFQRIIAHVYPDAKIADVVENIKNISSVSQFQREVVAYYIDKLIAQTVSKLSFSGIENIDPKKRYLFISNHRDIVLDSAFLNKILFENSMKTTQIAIGSNLLVYPWIEMLVKLNKSFVVKRNLPAREMLIASRELSSYIKHTILKKHKSIWIAQKEGRAKDGNDFTNSALLKMMHLSSKKTVSEYFKKLKIVPVSISYELEPCDKMKTAETYAKIVDGKYTKTPKEDLMSMSGGLLNQKGRVHFHFDKVLKSELKGLDNIKVRSDRYSSLAKMLDDRIHDNYMLFENNYMAYDIVSGNNKFTDKYKQTQIQEFEKYVEDSIKDIEGDTKQIKDIFLKIYANPVVNKHKLDAL